jgi:hypothetical protein
MDISSFAEQAWDERDMSPARAREEFEDHHVERDSSILTSIESVQDGSWWVCACSGSFPTLPSPASRMAVEIYRRLDGYN